VNEGVSDADAIQIANLILAEAFAGRIPASSEPGEEEEADRLIAQEADIPFTAGPVIVVASTLVESASQEGAIEKASEVDASIIAASDADVAKATITTEPLVEEGMDDASTHEGDAASLVDILFDIDNKETDYDVDDDLLTGSEAALEELNVEETTVDPSASSVPDFLKDPSVGEQTGTPPPSPLVLMPSDREPEPSPTTGLVTQEVRESSEGRAPTPVTSEVEMERGLHDDDDDEDSDGDDWWDDDAPLLDQGKQSHLSLEDLEEVTTQPASSTDQAAPVSAKGITFPIIIPW
jgi:hypothetical protein